MAETERGEVKAAVVELAGMVATIAHRCWEALGTSEAENIGRKCADLIERIEDW